MIWQEHQDNFLLLAYPDASNHVEDLCNILGCTKSALKTRVSKKKIRRTKDPKYTRYKLRKRYALNENYFKKWSTNMAYICGFLMADGCIYHTNRIMLCVNRKDKAILEFIAKEIQFTGDIRDTKTYNKKYKRHYRRSLLYFNSQEMKNDLTNIGIKPRKTSNETLPYIPDEFLFDFLRGLFDGDGTVNHINKSVSITSASEKLLQQIREQIKIGNVNKFTTKTGKYQYRLAICGTTEIKTLFQQLYNKENFWLKRKYVKYQNLISPRNDI